MAEVVAKSFFLEVCDTVAFFTMHANWHIHALMPMCPGMWMAILFLYATLKRLTTLYHALPATLRPLVIRYSIEGLGLGFAYNMCYNKLNLEYSYCNPSGTGHHLFA